MMTVKELTDKFYALKNEYYKVVNKDNASEALRWVIKTQEFLSDIISEAETVKTLTDDERNALTKAQNEIHSEHSSILALLQERLRKEG